MKRSPYLLLFVIPLWLAGCMPYQSTLTNAERSFPPTVADNVRLYLQGEIVPTATEIGEIIVQENSEEKGIAMLRDKAAEMGAEGIRNVEVQIQTKLLFILIPVPIDSYRVSGTAIRFTTLSRGTPQ